MANARIAPSTLPVKVKTLPVILKRKQIGNILQANVTNLTPLLSNVVTSNLFKEDIIYESKNSEFLKGEAQKVTITNRLNLLTNCSRTFARYTKGDGSIYERTSDNLTKLIGQAAYDTLFSALCSVINQELKIRGILALLSSAKKCEHNTTQTDFTGDVKQVEIKKKTSDISCQTYESYLIMQSKFRRLKRRTVLPYVVKDSDTVRKIVVQPENFSSEHFNGKRKRSALPQKNKKSSETLPVLEPFEDEEVSNDSIGNLSSLSIETSDELLIAPERLLEHIDQLTETTDGENKNTDRNGSAVTDGSQNRSLSLTNNRNEDETSRCQFQIAVESNIIRNETYEERKNALFTQIFIDYKFCITKDEDGNLPIHVAVMQNDQKLLTRQCHILKLKQQSVDILANGLTALKLSIFGTSSAITATLLNSGADPLLADEDDRTSFHLAAEVPQEHLGVIIAYCNGNAKAVLRNNEEFWEEAYENRTDDELAKTLMQKTCTQFDSQGYTPLMLAAKIGNDTNVKALLAVARDTVNTQMPNSGNTALYVTVTAACLDAEDRCNKSKISEHFMRTIETLLRNGADSTIENYSNCSINMLIQEFNITELSNLFASTLTSVNFFNGGSINPLKSFDSYMLIKDKNGAVNLKEINTNRTSNKKVSPDAVVVSQKTIDKPHAITYGKSTKIKDEYEQKSTKNKNETVVTEIIDITKEDETPTTVHREAFRKHHVNRKDSVIITSHIKKVKSSSSCSRPHVKSTKTNEKSSNKHCNKHSKSVDKSNKHVHKHRSAVKSIKTIEKSPKNEDRHRTSEISPKPIVKLTKNEDKHRTSEKSHKPIENSNIPIEKSSKPTDKTNRFVDESTKTIINDITRVKPSHPVFQPSKVYINKKSIDTGKTDDKLSSPDCVIQSIGADKTIINKDDNTITYSNTEVNSDCIKKRRQSETASKTYSNKRTKRDALNNVFRPKSGI